MATALVTQIAYAVQTLFDPAGTAGRLVDLGKLANYGLLTSFTPAYLFTTGVNGTWYDPSDINLTWRRNLLTYSEQFDNGVWSKVSSAVSVNQIAAPDGATTADFMVETATTAEHLILQSQALSWGAGSKVVGSVYAKSGGRRYIRLLIGGSNAGWNAYCVFDLIAASTGSPAANSAAIVSRSITDVGNGWYRCELVATPTVSSSSGAVIQFNTMLSMDANASNYTGDGTSGIYIWGAQLELGSTATPYQRITDGIQDYLQYQAQPVLYRDAAGTTPVTAVEQPVGLMLDKSKGLVLGPELVTNGDFSQGTTGWTTNGNASISAPSGALVVANATGATADVRAGTSAGFATVVGQTYRVQAICVAASGYNGTISFAAANGPTGPTVTNQYVAIGVQATFVFVATSTTTHVFAGANIAVGATFTVDNISVKELPGNHAFNSSGNSANFPVLSARYNLLTKTEQFDDAVWNNARAFVAANTAIAPNGTLTADKLTGANGTSGSHVLYQNFPANTYTYSCYAKAGEYSYLVLFTGAYGRWFNLATGQIGSSYVNNTTATILDVGNGWYRCTVTFTTGADNMYVGFAVSDGNLDSTGDGTSGIYIWGADLRIANDALNQPAYQRVNTSTDYDTVGFKPYLRFNGTNQWLQTNSIDFTYGDKMFVSAGVRKLSDAATGITCELSAAAFSNNGGFVLAGPGSTASAYSVGTRGTAFASLYFAAAAPTTNVVSAALNIAGATVYDEITIKNNGATASAFVETAGPAGTGNFGNYPFYIGARGGTSLWFNGRLYGMVVAGKQASAAEITSTETYLNQKTGAF